MTNYQQLANELKGALEKYKSQPNLKPIRHKAYENALALKREKYAKWRAKNPPTTERGKRWGKVGWERIIANIATMLNISTAAATGRYYRHQLSAEIVEQAKKQIAL